MATDNVTNRDLYESINSLRSEFGGAIQRLDDKFMTMEAGRLARAEVAINKLEVREATLNTKVVALVFIMSTTSSAIIYALASRLFR